VSSVNQYQTEARCPRKRSPFVKMAPNTGCSTRIAPENAIVTNALSLSLPPKRRRRGGNDIQATKATERRQARRTQEELRDLAGPRYRNCAPVHRRSVQLGGEGGVAYGFVASGEQLREKASDVSDLARPIEPHGEAPVIGLRSRAFPCEGQSAWSAAPIFLVTLFLGVLGRPHRFRRWVFGCGSPLGEVVPLCCLLLPRTC
jgi:hypothetical protein